MAYTNYCRKCWWYGWVSEEPLQHTCWQWGGAGLSNGAGWWDWNNSTYNKTSMEKYIFKEELVPQWMHILNEMLFYYLSKK